MCDYHECWCELFDKYDIDIDLIYSSKNIIYPKKMMYLKFSK